MDVETQEKTTRRIPKNIAVISLLVFTLLMLAVAGQITYTVINSDKVYNGVFIDSHNVGGMTRQVLTDMLFEKYQSKVKTEKISIKVGNLDEKVDYSKIKVNYDIAAAVDTAFEVGRKGNIIDRLTEIVTISSNPVKLSVPFTYDKESTNKIIQSVYDKTFAEVKEADISIAEDKVVLISGHHGISVEKDKLLSALEAMIKTGSGGDVDVPVIKNAPKKMDIEDLYKKISQEAADAKPEIKEKSVTIIPHVVGRSIDKSSLASIVEELEKTENTEKVLPVEFIQPKITTEIASANLFKDTLGSMTTRFSTGNQNDSNRGVNIRIAVSRINGTILAPGQVFSFNEVVGERSEAGGYKVAHTYVAGQIVDGIGGGICQVSTTLYNAVLFADVGVEERTNHMFTVGYVPYGRDAAVSWPYVDLKFKNTTNWPIKVEGTVTKSNQIIFSLVGTNENPGKTIVISPQTIKTVEPPPVKYIDDPTLPEGTEKVDHEAMKGYVIDTYKIVKQDGKVVSQEKLHRSTYRALQKTIKKGTKKTATPPVTPQAPPPQAPGVDEAANPPAVTVE